MKARIPRIGYLSGATPADGEHLVEAFKQGLRELGYVEGKTYVLEVRNSEGRSERFSKLAHVGRKVDVIVTGNDAATETLAGRGA
jgi:putative tryptophan/tyrosine transport system substrate-binding protein